MLEKEQVAAVVVLVGEGRLELSRKRTWERGWELLSGEREEELEKAVENEGPLAGCGPGRGCGDWPGCPSPVGGGDEAD